MKNKILDSLNEIDPRYIDEHLEWNVRNKHSTRSLILKTASVAACLLLMIISVIAFIPGGFLRTPPTSEATQTDTYRERDDGFDPPVIIYAELFDPANINEISPEPGSIVFSDDLCEIVNSSDIYENCLFAVDISFSMPFEESDEYKSLMTDIEGAEKLICERYDNVILPHINTHTPNRMDFNCGECLRLYQLNENDELELKKLQQNAGEILEIDQKEYVDKLRIYSDSFVEQLNLAYKDVTVIWTDASNRIESVPIWNVKIFHLTKEQIESITVPADLGVEITLLPAWVDVGDKIIYRDYEEISDNVN